MLLVSRELCTYMDHWRLVELLSMESYVESSQSHSAAGLST